MNARADSRACGWGRDSGAHPLPSMARRVFKIRSTDVVSPPSPFPEAERTCRRPPTDPTNGSDNPSPSCGSRQEWPQHLMRPRSGLAVGWSAVLCRCRFDAVRWASEWLLPTRLLLPPQRLPDGLDVIIEASSKLFASTPGFFDNWVFPHCPMPRQVAVVYRSLAE